METMQVPVTNSLKGFVEDQAVKKGFSSPGDYVQAVLLDLEKRELAKNELEAKLLEGVRSPKVEADEAFSRELEHELFHQYPELKTCDD